MLQLVNFKNTVSFQIFIPVDYKAESAVEALEEELKAGDSVLLIQPK